MGKKVVFVLFLIFVVLVSGFSSASSATLPSRIIGGVFSNAFSALFKWLWSLLGLTKIGIIGRPVMKYEEGYIVETLFDGSKLGIVPYSVEVLPSGELLVLDSDNSNMYKFSLPLSSYSRPKLVAGSSQGYSGHVDGRLRDARMNRPKGFTVDGRGNIYIADSMNMAIRKISDEGVTTIAGGKWARGGLSDAPSGDTKFSTDFDVVYIGSSCSLLVIDRGNRAIREIQLQYDDCAYEYGIGSTLGIVVLFAAAFFGYMLALVLHRVNTTVPSQHDLNAKNPSIISPYQKLPSSSVRSSLIPMEDGQLLQEEGLFHSLARLMRNTATSAVEIVGGLFGFQRNPLSDQIQHQYFQQKHPNGWPLQESFEIPDEDAPPAMDTRTPTPKKTYAFMAQDPEKTQLVMQSRAHYDWHDGEFQQPRKQKQQQQHYQQQYSSAAQTLYEQQYPSASQTFYEQSTESTTEIVFGAVEEQDKQHEVKVMKTVDSGDPSYERRTRRSRKYSAGNSHGY